MSEVRKRTRECPTCGGKGFIEITAESTTPNVFDFRNRITNSECNVLNSETVFPPIPDTDELRVLALNAAMFVAVQIDGNGEKVVPRAREMLRFLLGD